MGLDQFAYAGIGDEKEEIAYWRKHNRLHGWMEDLYRDRGNEVNEDEGGFGNDFNCVPVQLTLSDLEQLEAHVEGKSLPETGGFFFGNDSYDYEDENKNADGGYFHKEIDLQFIADARKAIAEGKEVYYDSWW
tara:strand:+ start:70 stop:468 length:399 start_codon:yes stop_codon:yes gene_type:complete